MPYTPRSPAMPVLSRLWIARQRSLQDLDTALRRQDYGEAARAARRVARYETHIVRAELKKSVFVPEPVATEIRTAATEVQERHLRSSADTVFEGSRSESLSPEIVHASREAYGEGIEGR